MTASERLRELAADYAEHAYPRDALEVLDVALPLIADCIEAAEKIEDPKDYWDWVTGYAPQLKERLAALRDALEEK